MNEEIRKVYSEIYEILTLVDTDYFRKIPESFIDFIDKERDSNYKPNIDKNLPLEEQNLLEDTINILALLKLDYWCTEDEKKEFLQMLNENETQYQNELREKYNPDNIFKNKESKKKVENTPTNNLPDKVEKRGFIKKTIEFLKNLFRH